MKRLLFGSTLILATLGWGCKRKSTDAQQKDFVAKGADGYHVILALKVDPEAYNGGFNKINVTIQVYTPDLCHV